MLRKREDSDVYEIDREITGKWAVEKNAELQEELVKLKGKYRRLEKQFKKLQVEHARILFDMDAVIEHEVDVKCKKEREENKKLKEELGEYKKMFEDHLKECYIKNTAEFLDKKFPKINGFMEEDTLQELRDLGKI